MPNPVADPHTPRGVRNNNPGNLKAAETYVWKGQQGADPKGFCIFADPIWGIRAICITWNTYHEQHGCDTMRQYITRWAPASENDTETYVSYMSTRLAIDPDAHLDIHGLAIPILAGLITYENGENPYPVETLSRGVTLSHER